MKILILGGYGVFGGRLAELLSDIPGLELLICGRNLAQRHFVLVMSDMRRTIRSRSIASM
jgi:nucleoside-diphosphate-sugar epimerase